jgi:hypothetical protein
MNGRVTANGCIDAQPLQPAGDERQDDGSFFWCGYAV